MHVFLLNIALWIVLINNVQAYSSFLFKNLIIVFLII